MAESSLWQTKKVLQLLLFLWLPILQPKFQLEPQQICLSYLVEFRDETEQLQREQTFYSARVRDESMWGGGAGVEVWGSVCLRGGGPHPPAISLSRGTGLRVQRSPAGRRSLSPHTDAHSPRQAVHYQYHTCTVTFTEVPRCLNNPLNSTHVLGQQDILPVTLLFCLIKAFLICPVAKSGLL